MPPAQADLLGDALVTPKSYAPDPRNVRNRLKEILALMRASERWPWEPEMIALYRERVIPYFCEKLPKSEARRFRAEFEAEAARLDAAA
ncbi:MAG: hypothetical protein H7X78_08045 [Methyloceanibacter sp.]|nr:hypothetical protein [Methyloceanibacter sp.]